MLEAAQTLAVDLGQTQAVQQKQASPAAKAPEWVPILPVPADAPPPPKEHPKHGAPTHVAAYRDERGALLGFVYRCEPPDQRKQPVPLVFCDNQRGGRAWRWLSAPKPRSLYGVEILAGRPDAPVLVVEGEPKCDAARGVIGDDMVVVSWAGGSKATHLADWRPLAGRNVLIWPDADSVGLQAAQVIDGTLSLLGVSPRTVRPPEGVPDGWDVGDAVRGGWTRERLLEHLAEPTQSAPTRRVVQIAPIWVKAGEIDIIAGLGEQALLASKIPIFQRGKILVRPVTQRVPASKGRTTIAAGLDEINPHALVDLLNQAVAWEVFDKKQKAMVSINPPPAVAHVILSRSAQSALPPIAGVITTPTLRPDGTVLCAHGYDPATRMYHVRDASLRLSAAVTRPTRKDAEEALAILNALIDKFPFVTALDRSVALSAVITPVVRGALPVVPMHVVKASTPGSGKSYLTDVLSMIATGRPCPVLAAGLKEEETEKRLAGLLLAGFPIISMDNVNGELGGDLLCQAIERPLIRIRPLGSSDIIEIESRATLYANGNGLRVRGDMTRRTLSCNLDAGMERPEQRTFEFDPVDLVLADRGKYVSACLIIVRAYQQSGVRVAMEPIASFGEWSQMVRGALIWLGCEDPAKSMEEAREEDPDLGTLATFLSLWKAHIGIGTTYTTRQIIDAGFRTQVEDDGFSRQETSTAPELKEALVEIAGMSGHELNSRKLGKWLARNEGRIVGSIRLRREKVTASGGAPRWTVEDITKPPQKPKYDG